MNKKFAIIFGEPNSINSEIIFKIWKKNRKKFRDIFIIGNIKLFKEQLEILNFKNIKFREIKSVNDVNSSKYLHILNINLNFKQCFNVKKKDSSEFIKNCFDVAHNFAIKRKIKGFINCPIDKSRFLNNSTPGITEYLSKKNKTLNKEAMVIFNKNLSVSPITTHIKINQVTKRITKNVIIDKVRVLNRNLNTILKKKIRIGILGLNPHNDEMKANSTEKITIIPAVKKLRKENINIIGPIPADTAFLKDNRGFFDLIIGMYHDQVLAPFKTIYEFNALNLTLGMKYLRLSPDHGTGKDLIGKNRAKTVSLENCIDFLNKY